jgi:hypothetical protein
MGWEFCLFCLGFAAVAVGCIVPNRFLPGSLPNDKFLHFASFAVLSALALRLANGRAEAAWWLAGLMVAGAGLECAQALVPDRRFCWRDIGANAAGIAFTVGCAGLWAIVA